MDKLLHERLREHKRFHEFKFLDGKSTDMLTEYIAREIADEIERHYIPRPRLDDGEPDSLEKLRDDMSELVAYGGQFDDRATLHEVQAWEDRLTALIESGA